MKNAIIGITMIIVICLLSLIHMSITTENVRQNELDKSMNTAIRTTMDMSKVKKTYEISSEEELMAEFNRNLLSQIHSDSDIEVQVMGINLKEGLLDIKVVSKFKYPTGAKGQVESRKTIIFDENQKDRELKYIITKVEGGGTETSKYLVNGNNIVSKVNTNFSISNKLYIDCNFKQGKKYKISIFVHDTKGKFIDAMSGDIALGKNIQKESGTWKKKGYNSIYTFTASKTASEATLFDGGFYLQGINPQQGKVIGTMTISEVN